MSDFQVIIVEIVDKLLRGVIICQCMNLDVQVVVESPQNYAKWVKTENIYRAVNVEPQDF